MRVYSWLDLAFYLLPCPLLPFVTPEFFTLFLSTPTLLYLSLRAIYAASLSPSPSSSHILYGMSLAPTLSPFICIKGVSYSGLSLSPINNIENLSSPLRLRSTTVSFMAFSCSSIVLGRLKKKKKKKKEKMEKIAVWLISVYTSSNVF